MCKWHKVVRFAALALLLSAAVDLFVVDFSVPSFCGETGMVSVLAPDGSDNSQSTLEGAKDYRDDCFCCCSHIVLSHTVELNPVELISFTSQLPRIGIPITSPFRIYLPPRA